MKHLKLLLLATLLALINNSASAYDFYVDGIYYNYVSQDDLTCEVTYKEIVNGVSRSFYSGNFIIPSTVTYDGKTYSVIRIGYDAFYYCSRLTSVEIPNSVTSIGYDAFRNCSSLTSVEIPNSVTSIGGYAFGGCSSLTSVVIPNSVTSIGYGAFSYCSSLPVENNLRYADTYLVEVVDKTLSTYPIKEGTKWIGSSAFSDCSRLTSVVIPNSVTSIGGLAFERCRYLTSVEIPNSVTEIGGYAFNGCSSLTSVEIPNSVTSIGKYAFFSCRYLTSVEIPNSVTSIGEGAFSFCTSLESISGKFATDDHRCWIVDGVLVAFAPRGLTKYNIPKSVTKIGGYAFGGCSSLTSVEIPNSVTSIGDYAFEGCSRLTSAVIGNSVTSIGDYAFEGCSRLTSAVIGNSVTSIGKYAYKGCTSLKEVTCLAAEPPTLGSSAFQSIPSDAILYVPASAYTYVADKNWSTYFSEILPISCDTYSMEIGLPEDYSDGRYRNMTLELVEKDSDKAYKIVVSDKDTYTFSGLPAGSSYTLRVKNRWGDVLGEISAIEVSDEDVKVVFESLLQPKTVTMNVLTPDGEDVTERTTVSWYKADGELMMQGASISGVLAGSEMAYTIALPDEMLTAYTAPAKQTLKVGEKENAVRHTLEALGQVTLAGNVYDANGKALPYAVLTITPLVNGKYGNAVTATTDAAGHYEIELPNYAVKITVTANNHVSQTIELPCVADGLGDISLEKVNGLCINVTTDYADQANVAYRVLDMSGNEMSGCIYQGRSIVMPATVGIGDELTVVAYSKNNRFKDTPQRVVLDSKNTYVDISIVEYGCLNAKCDGDGYGSVAILYNAAGEQAAKAAFREGAASFETLPDGQYTVVAMKKSGVLNSVLNLSALKSTGLTAGTDFLTATATVESGAVAEVTLGAIPELDESKLYLASGDGTYFMPGKAELTISNYQVLKAKVDLKPEYAGRVKNAVLVADIPSSCEFVEGSVISGLSRVYQKDGNRILIPLENIGDLSRFCIIPLIGGETRLSAFVQAVVDGEEVLLPIGSAYFEALNFSLATVEKTSKTTIPLRGAAMPNSEVLIYDNETLVGKTTSLANGQWTADITFAKPYSHSMHEIYAEVLTSDGKRLLTETRVVDYDKSYVDVEKVTMLYGSYKIVFDPTSGKTSSGYYSYVPGTSDFTFTADFSNTDPSLVSNVNFKVLASDGTTRTLEGKYNEATGNWVASSKYADTHKLPVNVKVEYVPNEVTKEYDTEMENDYEEFYNQDLQSIASLYTNGDLELLSDSNDELYFSIKPIGETNREYFRISALSYSIAIQGLETPYTRVINDTTDCCFQDTIINNEYRLTVVDNLHEYAFSLSYYGDKPNNQPNNKRIINIAISAFAGVFTNWLEKNMWLDIVKDWSKKFDYDKTTYLKLYNELPKLLNAKCNDGNLKIKDPAKYNDLNSQFKLWVGDVENFFNEFEYNYTILEMAYKRRFLRQAGMSITLSSLFGAASKISGTAFATSYPNLPNAMHTTYNSIYDVTFEVLGNGLGLLNGTNGASILQAFTNWHILNNNKLTSNCEKLGKRIRAAYSECDDDDEDDEDDNTNNYPTPPVTPSIDPSGYVYEAVPSNRLQGVTATVYYMQQTEDMYGDITEEPVVWNAAEFGQQNPLMTDEQGMYAWDVPQGMWQVKFEKEGYETTYSEWLPVPPPQLDVNIAMVQAKQPEVTNLHAYTDGITIEFDKFMLPEMLTPENIKVSQNGTDIAGTVTLINSEAGKDGKSYCSKIEFVPTTELAEGEATVFVSRQVKSYADVQMSADFTKTVKVETRVSGIDVAETVKVFSGSTVEIEATVLPMSAAAGKKFVMEEMNPYIASVDKGSITMDGNGHVSFEVKGLIPGKAVVRLSVEGYDVYQDVTINVVDVEKVSAPAATLASGSVVVKGTEVRLYCATEGATIYYTTDGSCPCDLATAYVYDGTPIVIDETVTIKAIAMKQDMEDSRIAEFTYIVEVPTAIATAKATDELRIYPLPMRDVVNITVGGKEIRRITINTMNGTTVRSLDNTGTELQLNVQSLSPGIYIVNATTADGTLHKKVLKME